MSMKMGAIQQIGYVVRDIDLSMRQWLQLGVGPWFYRDVEASEFRYYGKKSPGPKLGIALANSGTVQIELVQQQDDSPSLYLDTLKRQGDRKSTRMNFSN